MYICSEDLVSEKRMQAEMHQDCGMDGLAATSLLTRKLASRNLHCSWIIIYNRNNRLQTEVGKDRSPQVGGTTSLSHGPNAVDASVKTESRLLRRCHEKPRACLLNRLSHPSLSDFHAEAACDGRVPSTDSHNSRIFCILGPRRCHHL